MITYALFLRVLRERLFLLVVAVLLGAVFGLLLIQTFDAGPRQEVTISVATLGFTETVDAPQQYDGYYRIESQRRFGDVLGQALARPDFQARLATEEGIALGRISRVSPLDYRASFTSTRSDIDVQASVLRLQQEADEVLKDAADRFGEPLQLGATIGPVVQVPSPWSPMKAAIAGALLGFILGVMIALLGHAAREGALLMTEVVEVELG